MTSGQVGAPTSERALTRAQGWEETRRRREGGREGTRSPVRKRREAPRRETYCRGGASVKHIHIGGFDSARSPPRRGPAARRKATREGGGERTPRGGRGEKKEKAPESACSTAAAWLAGCYSPSCSFSLSFSLSSLLRPFSPSACSSDLSFSLSPDSARLVS